MKLPKSFDDIKGSVVKLIQGTNPKAFLYLCSRAFAGEKRGLNPAIFGPLVRNYYESPKPEKLDAILEHLEKPVNTTIKDTYERAKDEGHFYSITALGDNKFKLVNETTEISDTNLVEKLPPEKEPFEGVYEVSLEPEFSCTGGEFQGRLEPFNLPCKHIIIANAFKEKEEIKMDTELVGVAKNLTGIANWLDSQGYRKEADSLDIVLQKIAAVSFARWWKGKKKILDAKLERAKGDEKKMEKVLKWCDRNIIPRYEREKEKEDISAEDKKALKEIKKYIEKVIAC